MSEIPLKKIDENRWEIPQSFRKGMRVPGLVFANEKLLKHIRKDKALEQVANVAHLPGIQRYSLAMPDIHWGYGFPIGGVAATDPHEEGVISPGGIGFDINCGIRLLRSNLTEEEIRPQLRGLVTELFKQVPCGVGESGELRLNQKEMRAMVREGSAWAVKRGYGLPEDLKQTEAEGALDGAQPEAVSERAYQRGKDQLGTLGSGNHFLEVQVIDQVENVGLAEELGLFLGQVTVMIHSGSRGFGYQVCDDNLQTMVRAMAKYKISVPDKQLACAPIKSPEGQSYLGAMRSAANFAWNNRQCLMAITRRVFEKYFGQSAEDLGMKLIYDVAHNIAKFEKFKVEGKEKTLCIHRKGATRAYPRQPVIVPGDMGRNSYLLMGTDQALDETFGTSCHGAGRAMSRRAALKAAAGRSIEKELGQQGIVVMGRGKRGIAEEQPAAYKNVNDVVEVMHRSGIARKVVRMRPIGVIKG